MTNFDLCGCRFSFAFFTECILCVSVFACSYPCMCIYFRFLFVYDFSPPK